MKTTIYVTVYIEGKEENLPEKNGEYIICKDVRIWSVFYCSKYREITKDYWLDIDWYLLPKELPDDEEMNNEANNYAEIDKQDFGVKENASLDFVRGANWFKSEILNK